MFNKVPVRQFILAAALLPLLFAAACSTPAASKDVEIGNEANGKMITLKQGETLAVRLESNPTTGYSWALAEVDKAILQPQGEPEYAASNKDPRIAGSGGWETFHFNPGKTGQTNLKIVYRRAWEKDVQPIQTFSVQVTVE